MQYALSVSEISLVYKYLLIYKRVFVALYNIKSLFCIKHHPCCTLYLPISRPIRRTVIFSLEILEKK